MRRSTPENSRAPTLAGWIREHRESRGLRALDLAEALRVSPARVSEWESGRSSPSLEQVRDLAVALVENGGHVAGAGEQQPRTHIWLDERGVAWIGQTNTKVKEVVLDALAGLGPEQIHDEHPHLSLGAIHSALSYYYDHKESEDAQIERDARDLEEMRQRAGESPFVKRMRALGRLR